MSIEDTIRTDGLLCGLGIAAESILYAGQKVAAIIDRDTLAHQMADAGFNQVSEVTIEIFKGTKTSTDVITIDGVSVPLDLRGVTPKNLDLVVIDGINRTVSDVDSSGTAWVITTRRAN